MTTLKLPFLFAAIALIILRNSHVPATSQDAASGEDWISLFNGKDLSDWIVKIRRHEPGVNFGNTFRVENGVLKVSYDQYATFNDQFGHIFYKDPFSHYRLRLEYRFVGEQAAGGPSWATRNSGIMLHSQDPKTMPAAQDFPISIEFQFLGGLGNNMPRTTGNMCSPGTHIVFGGKLDTRHCINSTSDTFDGDQWVTAEAVVLGAQSVTHRINGKTVIEYTNPQIGGGNVSGHRPDVKIDGQLLSSGHIALQSESHPIEFRRVELLNLQGCMNPSASNYKKYYVESAPETCK